MTVKNNIILYYMLDEKNYLNLFFFWVFLRFLNGEILFLVGEEYSYSSQVSNSLKHIPETDALQKWG